MTGLHHRALGADVPRPGLGRFRSARSLGLGSHTSSKPARVSARPDAADGAAPATAEPRTVSKQGLQLIMDSEGFSQHLYDDPAGHCTIGFGHLVHKGPCNGMDPSELPYALGISRQQGENLLRQDAQRFVQLVNRTVLVPLTQAQFDALVDFAYNVGFKAFRSSTLLKKLNAGDYAAVPAQLRRFVKAGGVELPGLVTRRAREAEMFASGLQAVPGGTGAGRR